MTEKMVRAPEHTRKKSALPPKHTYSSFFFKGVVGMLKQDGHPNLYLPPTPLKKNLNTHPDVTRSCSWSWSCLGLGLGLALGLGLGLGLVLVLVLLRSWQPWI